MDNQEVNNDVKEEDQPKTKKQKKEPKEQKKNKQCLLKDFTFKNVVLGPIENNFQPTTFENQSSIIVTMDGGGVFPSFVYKEFQAKYVRKGQDPSNFVSISVNVNSKTDVMYLTELQKELNEIQVNNRDIWASFIRNCPPDWQPNIFPLIHQTSEFAPTFGVTTSTKEIEDGTCKIIYLKQEQKKVDAKFFKDKRWKKLTFECKGFKISADKVIFQHTLRRLVLAPREPCEIVFKEEEETHDPDCKKPHAIFQPVSTFSLTHSVKWYPMAAIEGKKDDHSNNGQPTVRIRTAPIFTLADQPQPVFIRFSKGGFFPTKHTGGKSLGSKDLAVNFSVSDLSEQASLDTMYDLLVQRALEQRAFFWPPKTQSQKDDLADDKAVRKRVKRILKEAVEKPVTEQYPNGGFWPRTVRVTIDVGNFSDAPDATVRIYSSDGTRWMIGSDTEEKKIETLNKLAGLRWNEIDLQLKHAYLQKENVAFALRLVRIKLGTDNGASEIDFGEDNEDDE